MTEPRAAYEAAQNEAMHTGDYAALTAYACTVADADDEPPAAHVDADDYTWAGPQYPAVPALTADNARLRAQITDLHCDYSGQIATLELRVRELESERLSLNEAIAVADKLNAVQRVRELDAWIAAVPSGALIDYYYGSEARSYDGRAATSEVGAWIRRLEDENAAAMRGEVRP